MREIRADIDSLLVCATFEIDPTIMKSTDAATERRRRELRLSLAAVVSTEMKLASHQQRQKVHSELEETRETMIFNSATVREQIYIDDFRRVGKRSLSARDPLSSV